MNQEIPHTPAISNRYKCIFIHVPKAGGSSIERTSIFNDQREITGKVVAGHTKAVKFREKFPREFNDYFKFAFVRNPFDRLVSAFFYLNSKASNEYGERIRNKYLAKYNGKFDKFCLDFFNNESNINKVIHFQPQTTFVCDDDTVIVDYIGKLENMESDFKFVCSKIGYDYESLAIHRKGKHRHYTSYYTDETRKIVEHIYQKDMDLFGYTYEECALQIQQVESRRFDIFNQFKIVRDFARHPHKINRIKGKLQSIIKTNM